MDPGLQPINAKSHTLIANLQQLDSIHNTQLEVKAVHALLTKTSLREWTSVSSSDQKLRLRYCETPRSHDEVYTDV